MIELLVFISLQTFKRSIWMLFFMTIAVDFSDDYLTDEYWINPKCDIPIINKSKRIKIKLS